MFAWSSSCLLTPSRVLLSSLTVASCWSAWEAQGEQLPFPSCKANHSLDVPQPVMSEPLKACLLAPASEQGGRRGLKGGLGHERKRTPPSLEKRQTAPATDACALPAPRILVWNAPEYLPGAFSNAPSPPPPRHPRAGGYCQACCEASGTDPLAQSCPGAVGLWGCGAAVTADGRASCQIPETRPAVGYAQPGSLQR